MSIFAVEGGCPLSGTVRVQGAKNSVLPILAACLLAPGESVIRNCPALSDVCCALEILRGLGCGVEREGDAVTVDARTLTGCAVPEALMREMRSSVVFLGAILGRTGAAEMSLPGGCELGPRPIDLHLMAIRALGGRISGEGGGLSCRGEALRGGEIVFPLPSVGATENAMLCAAAAPGVTTIINAAREPEIVDLQAFLRAMGARVEGAGSSTVTVEGGRRLHGAEFSVMADRIAAATYLAAAAAAGGRVELLGADWRHLSTVTAALSEAGCRVRSEPGRILLAREAPLRATSPIRTAPYPGFPTDAQPLLMAALCRSAGTTVFEENIFESRYRHVDELSRMGADIRVSGRVAVVSGVPALRPARLRCADLRGGAALTVAALAAEGESIISGLEYIDRGYADLDGGLRGLGAQIVRRDDG